MNSDPMNYQLTAKAVGVLAEFAHLTLYNGHLDTVLKGYGTLEASLPQGLYKLVIVQGAQMIERSIRLDKPVQIEVTLAESASSVPAEGMANMHEYYSNPCKEYTFTPTTTAGHADALESLFLFFRYPNDEAFKTHNPQETSLGTGFILLDSDRKRLCPLEGAHIQEELIKSGWLALHIRLSPGTYYLYYNGRKADKELRQPALPAREIPITVFKDWQTQCFMTFGNGPVFRSWFVSLRATSIEKEVYRPENNNFYAIEGLLQKFTNGVFYLPDNVIDELADKKWYNPILGLLAAYAYFHSGKHDRDELFQQVMSNCAQLLGPDSPDAIALATAASAHFPQYPLPAIGSISAPCMFLTGLRAIVRAHSNRIAPGSFAEEAVGKLLPDLFWTSYTPISRFRISSPAISRPDASSDRQLPGDTLSQQISANFKASRIKGDGKFLTKAAHFSLPNAVPRKPKILQSWVANSLMDLLLHPGAAQRPIPDLAVSLHVTPHILGQTVMAILDNEKPITAYLKGKAKDPLFKAFSQENIERLKRIQRNDTRITAS